MSITVISPNGGETWETGKTYDITWTSSDVVDVGGYVRIELMKGDTVVGTVVESTPNNGLFKWAIWEGRSPGTDYKIKITSIVDTAHSDTSDDNFTITSGRQPGIRVVSPNGGETWLTGKTYDIMWTSSDSAIGGFVRIELMQADTVVGTVVESTPNNGLFRWAIWEGRHAGTDYNIRITKTDNSSYTDKGNNNFTIIMVPKIEKPSFSTNTIMIALIIIIVLLFFSRS